MTSPKPDDLRDPRFDAAWRAASSEEPPAALDDAIRAAARREVGAGPRPSAAAHAAASVPNATRPERWWWPLAAAATIGAIAFGLLQLTPTENGAPAVVSDMPAQSAAPTRPVPPAPIPTPAPVSKARSSDSALSSAASSERDSKPSRSSVAAPAPDAFPAGKNARPSASRADASPDARQDAVGSGITTGSPPPPAMQREAQRPAARETIGASGASVRMGGVQHEPVRREIGAPLPADEWIALIRRLRDEGNTDAVAKELEAFRAAYPDHEQRLPADLRDWRPAVK